MFYINSANSNGIWTNSRAASNQKGNAASQTGSYVHKHMPLMVKALVNCVSAFSGMQSESSNGGPAAGQE